MEEGTEKRGLLYFFGEGASTVLECTLGMKKTRISPGKGMIALFLAGVVEYTS